MFADFRSQSLGEQNLPALEPNPLVSMNRSQFCSETGPNQPAGGFSNDERQRRATKPFASQENALLAEYL
jgi:hypothetical protein